jgi:perosamine synthetase
MSDIGKFGSIYRGSHGHGASDLPLKKNALFELAQDGDARSAKFRLPRSPVFDWSNLRPTTALRPPAALHSVEETPHRIVTTSGRAALFQALMQLNLHPGSTVLVPTYHCPSMVAPILLAGLEATFYGIHPDGEPNLATISLGGQHPPAAMIAAHYFGLPRSLEAARAWCDANSIILIEDCAHCFFGLAGERSVGQWGDYAIASLTKFFPVPEAGLLISARRPLREPDLTSPTRRAELKGWIDVLEVSSHHGRLRGANGVLRLLFILKRRLRRAKRSKCQTPHVCADTIEHGVVDCDMGRVSERPLFISQLLFRRLDRHRVYWRRRENFSAYAASLTGLAGAHPLHSRLPDGAAPYVFPLWVEDADRVYHALRQRGMPVFRWDRVWPHIPVIGEDCAPQWRHHVIQLLCHQDFGPSDIKTICRTVSDLLSTMPDPIAQKGGREGKG